MNSPIESGSCWLRRHRRPGPAVLSGGCCRSVRQLPDGSLVARDRGRPQSSAVSPLLANLFMHYAFDAGMAGRRIRVLPDDEDSDLVEGLLEGAEYVRARGEIRSACRDLRAEELAHGSDVFSDGLQCLGPARFDDFVQRSCSHGRLLYWLPDAAPAARSGQSITAARTHSTSGRWPANCCQLSPSSALAKTSPLRLPK
jgi:hypothetical protein